MFFNDSKQKQGKTLHYRKKPLYGRLYDKQKQGWVSVLFKNKIDIVYKFLDRQCNTVLSNKQMEWFSNHININIIYSIN